MPDLGLGAQLVVEPTDWLYAAIAVADAEADGRETGFRTTFHGNDYFFSAFEFGFLPEWDTAGGKLPGAYRFGVWYDPQPKARYFNNFGGLLANAPLKRDDIGFYFNMDQMLWNENPELEGDTQGVGMFARYGFAHGEVNELEHFWSIGGQAQGLIPTRDDDVLGVGMAQGVLSTKSSREGNTPRRETVIEVYYSIPLTGWLTLTPDFQWILDPGAMGDGDDSFVAGLRVQASF
jgi:porin